MFEWREIAVIGPALGHRHMEELDWALDPAADRVGHLDHDAHVFGLNDVLVGRAAVAEMVAELDPSRHRVANLGQDRECLAAEIDWSLFKNIIQAGPGAFGNAATRLEAHVVKGGVFVYGSYPDLDELYQHQAVELDHKKREAILHKMQQAVYERTIYAPIWQLAFINGVGPRVGESGFGLIARFPYTAPYEDITLKGA
jgi:hypothetical protein